MTNVKVNIPKLNTKNLRAEIPNITQNARYREDIENVRAVSAKGQALAAEAEAFVSKLKK